MYWRIDGAVGQHLQLVPRPELVAEGEHVGVGADARVAEQVPGAAEALAALEDRDGLVRELGGELAGRADAGQAGADDQDVEVLWSWIEHGRRATPAGLDRSRQLFIISRQGVLRWEV